MGSTKTDNFNFIFIYPAKLLTTHPRFFHTYLAEGSPPPNGVESLLIRHIFQVEEKHYSKLFYLYPTCTEEFEPIPKSEAWIHSHRSLV